jgi:hypothetical protein
VAVGDRPTLALAWGAVLAQLRAISGVSMESHVKYLRACFVSHDPQLMSTSMPPDGHSPAAPADRCLTAGAIQTARSRIIPGSRRHHNDDAPYETCLTPAWPHKGDRGGAVPLGRNFSGAASLRNASQTPGFSRDKTPLRPLTWPAGGQPPDHPRLRDGSGYVYNIAPLG